MIDIPPYPLLRRYFSQYVGMIERLLTLEQLFPGVVLTSWYRSIADNERVGGAPLSQHRLGFAFDVAVPPHDIDRFAAIASGLGFVAVPYAEHVHLQVFERNSIPPTAFDFASY